ncbi:hypothetical protein Vretimale_14370 [Volvox reticuliferus]|uniref:Uncharacterized protein n=1 Tax=Volvox reticuliferus TaxID=1737510 RepID=A0A8J4CK71_9CHLO|nr:hypothetical protein Vretifemale_13396 [Volvox reticuliferus]GIM10780.1 hypothetical protein Vretimale_14370 [Volvox reticuliferus]
MPPDASLGSAANGHANAAAGGGSSGGGGSSRFLAQGPGSLQGPPPPDDLPALKLLQQGDLFGGARGSGGRIEVPLLVPLPNGAVTNINFDESYGEPQEALIERYLVLMGLAPRPPPPPSEAAADAAAPLTDTFAANADGGRISAVAAKVITSPDPNRLPGAQYPPVAATAVADSNWDNAHGTAEESQDSEDQDDADLLLSVQRPRPQPPPPPSPGATPALVALGLDRPTLSRRGIPEALIGSLHRGIAGNAAAFFRTCLAEQRRLVALTHGSGPEVPLADRLLAFITGTESQLKDGSVIPDLVDLRKIRDNQTILDAVSPPHAGDPVPFYHELVHQRQQPSTAPAAPESSPAAPEEPALDEFLDLDKITALATAGNVPGLRALMRNLVSAADYTRSSLMQRLKSEGERAQRECVRATEAKMAADRLREQLAARNVALAERGVELEAACRRATAAEEALVTERSIVAGLRDQLRQLTADYEAQHRQLRAGLEAHLTRPASAKLLAGAALLGSRSGAEGAQGLDGEVHALSSQLATTRAELALAELSCQQERATARQLRVMLESSRGTVDMHAGRAAAAGAEVERLTRLVASSRDLASASTGGMAMLEQQLAQEKAAHRRTIERLQAAAWKFEQARTSVVDVRARAAHNLRKLQTALADVNLRAVTAERQLADATVELRHTRSELEGANNNLEAFRDRTARMEEDMQVLRDEAITTRLDSKEVAEKLQETEIALRTAEARVTQMQQKVMEDADTVLAGRRASQRLEVLEKEHAELQSLHESLQESHNELNKEHQALQSEMAEAQRRIGELEIKEARLEDLTAKHEELKTAKARLEQQYAGAIKAKSLLSSELAGLKRHADVLAEQVQEYRKQADGARLALEEEKEALRHTREELSMTASKRDELETRCADLTTVLEGMEVRMKNADNDVQRSRRTAELAGHQRAEAFAMRDAMMKVRITLTCEVKEYLATIESQVQQMVQYLAELRSSLTTVQSRLLDMEPTSLEGTTAELPKVPYEMSQKMIDALFKMVAHAAQLLDTQAEVRKALVDRIEQLEDGIKDRLSTATDYWRQVLVLSRGTPKSMVQMVEHMTSQACRELDLDPANPLSKMVPLGVLEEAGIQLNTQYERAGMLRDRADESKAKSDAAAKLLEYEREMSAARSAEFQSLVDTLSREVNRLKQRVSSLEANNVLQQRATADMQRLLSDAEWKVAKAKERETLLGIKFMVPLGRDTKAVQTMYSDLYMFTGPLVPTPGITIPAAGSPHSRPQLLHARSMGPPETAPLTDDGELLGGGGGGEDGSAEHGFSGAAASTPEAPGSPASLPPLSALNSPSIHATSMWGSGGTVRNPQPPGVAPSRPQSNLSRASSAVPPPPAPMRCTSPDLSNGSAGTADGVAADGGAGQQMPRPAFAAELQPGRSPTASVSSNGGGSGGGGPQGRPPPQRRRHPDEVPRRSGGSVLSPVPSLNSMHSVNSVASDGLVGGSGGAGNTVAAAGARGGSNGGGAERGYTSDGNAASAAMLDASNSDEDEYAPPSPTTSPPLLLRTPSVSATAANAAAFAANAAGGGKGSGSGLSAMQQHQHVRPATAGPPSGLWGGHHPHHHAARLSGAVLHSSRPASPVLIPIATPPTPSGIPHGWQHTPWDWLPDVVQLTRGAVPYSRQALLEIIADIHYTKGLHDQVAAAASFPATSMQQYIGAYFEARHGPRGSNPPTAELALAQLLVSLEAHSALYEVMLFARVAGLQAWTGKGGGRNGNNGASRPTTAQSLKMSAGSNLGRPRTPRDASISPYASSGLSPSRPGTAASVAAARNSRTMSARNSVAAPPVLLGLVPSSRPSTAASPPLAYGNGSGTVALDVSDLILMPNGGETVMRLRTGLSPTITTSNAGGGGSSGGGYFPASYSSLVAHSLHPSRRSGSTGTLPVGPSIPQQGTQQALHSQQQQQPQQQPLPAPKPQLRVRPEVFVSDQLLQLLGRLGDVSGMEALSQFVSTGRLLGKLRQADLGQPLAEELHPELHFTVIKVCSALGLQEAPELLMRPTLPYGADAMLLQVPNVATGSLGVLAQGDTERQPVAHAVAGSSAAAGGWRRRAVLLLTPALVAAAEPAVLGQPVGPIGEEELQAMLGSALAPMAMPGGPGWRLDVQVGASTTGGAASGAAGGGGAGTGGAASSGPSGPATSSPTLLSAAEVITVVNAAALKGRAVPSVLPSQLQFKWERLLAHLRNVAAAVTMSADRGALLATQNMAAAVRAVFREAAGLGLQDGTQLGSGEELLLQAQTMPLSEDEVMGMATLPMHDAAADGGETRRGYALARVAALTRWAEGPEYRQILRSAVM